MSIFPSVRFIHETSSKDKNKEIVIRNFCAAASSVLPLPVQIEVRIADLNPNVYGSTSLDWRFKNRLNINSILQLNELPLVLTHELIHMSQLHEGLLSITRDGRCVWKNKVYTTENLSYEEYLQLPWEADVSAREKTVLDEILKNAKKLLTKP